MKDAQSNFEMSLHERWNDTGSHCDTNRCIHWLFERRAEHAPDAPAVDDGRSVLSYAELNEGANELAHHLVSIGIGPGSLVGVCMARGTDLIGVLLGILKSGAAYVPIEPAWPEKRLKLIVNELRLATLVVDPQQLGRWDDCAGRTLTPLNIVCIDSGRVRTLDGTGGRSLAKDNPRHSGTADHRAYVIFTSGSSGRPKAVAVRHRSVINLIDWVNKTFSVGSTHKLLFTTSIAFDLSVYDIFGMLAAGGTIRVAIDQEVRDPRLLAEILHNDRITFWDSAPAVFERLFPFFKPAGARHAMRLVFLSGDWVPLSLPSRLERAFPGCRLIVLGGATEATVWSNFYEVGEIDPAWKSIPYGRPIRNARYFILDQDLIQSAVGAAGNLYIGGECLAEGYANDAELTVRKFIANPLIPNERLYDTGDRARYFSDGNIELLGRADRQAKIRGFRVEPAEIEAALQRHPAVRQAVVIVEGVDSEPKRLVAHVTLRETAALDATPSDLKIALRKELPEYMVPTEIHVLREIPLTMNGKIDRSALRSAVLGSCSPSAQQPRSDIEHTLAMLWCRILRIESVEVYESFFDLGGDSLQTVEMIAAAAGAGLDLRLQDLHDHPTIRELAATCTKSDKLQIVDQKIVVDTVEIPLTPIQHWFFGRSLNFPGRYNTVFAFDITESIDIARLRRAMRHLQTHHAALRLRFERIDGRWVQSVAPPSAPTGVIVWDQSSLHSQERRADVERRLSTLRRKMDLKHGPLVFAIILNPGFGCSAQLLLVCHHLVIDAASIRLLVEDLSIILDQIDKHETLRLPSSTSYRQWAQRLGDFAQSAEAMSEADRWLGLPWKQVRPLPTDFAEGVNNYRSSCVARAELLEWETEILQHHLPRRMRVSTGEILLAACARVLAWWAKHETVLIDLTGHGRHAVFNDVSLSRTVGYITSNVPLVITVGDGVSMTEVAVTVREHLRSMPRGGIGFGILRYLSPENDACASLRKYPEPEIKFNYLGTMLSEPVASRRLRPASSAWLGSFPACSILRSGAPTCSMSTFR